MKLHYSLDDLNGIRNSVITTGTFDGVHIGHKTIIERLKKLAEDINGETVLITFHPHPRRVLYPDTEGKDLLMILSQKEKIDLLRRTGLDHLIILNFTKEFSKISSHDFVQQILVKLLNVKIVVVGFNHHFGHNREGNFEYLYQLSKEHGFDVEEIPEQDIQNESVSSTKIRKALLEGNIQRANAYLDHYYIIKGNLQYNCKISSSLKIPIYSIEIEENVKLLPPDGLYAVSVEDGELYSKGMLIITDWEVVNNVLSPDIRIELSLFNEDIILNHKDEVTIYFHKKMREILKNTDLNLLSNQLKKDRRDIEEMIF